MMSNKKTGSRKKTKNNSNHVLMNSNVNQSGGRSAAQIATQYRNKKSVFVLMSPKIINQLTPKINASKGIGHEQKAALLKAITKQLSDAIDLSKPAPSIIENKDEREELTKAFTDEKLVEGPLQIGNSITEMTKSYTAIQADITKLNTDLNESIKEVETTPVTQVEMEITTRNARFISAIQRVIEKKNTTEAEIQIPSVSGDKLVCSIGLFTPIDKIAIPENETPSVFDPQNALPTVLNQEIKAVINKHKEQHKEDQPLFTNSSSPAVATGSDGDDDDNGGNGGLDKSLTPVTHVKQKKRGEEEELMVSHGVFDKFAEVLGSQIKALCSMIKNLTLEALYKFKVLLSSLITKLERLMFNSFPILISAATLYVKQIVMFISTYAKKFGLTIAQTVSSGFVKQAEIVFGGHKDISETELAKICKDIDGKGLFFVEDAKIVWRFFISGDSSKISKLKSLADTINQAGSSLMNMIFTSFANMKKKLKEMKDFVSKHLSEDGIAALQKRCMRQFADLSKSTHLARRSFMVSLRERNLRYIKGFADIKQTVGNFAKDVRGVVTNGVDRTLFNIIFTFEEADQFSIGEMLRKAFFRMNLLSQSGCIRSLTSTNEKLKAMNAALKDENEKLVLELHNSPLSRSAGIYNDFLNRVFSNIKEHDSSFLIRDAKMEHVTFTNHAANLSGMRIMEYLVTLHWNTQRSAAKDEIDEDYWDKGKTPYRDLCRLLGILWDLDVLEKTVDGSLTRRPGIIGRIGRFANTVGSAIAGPGQTALSSVVDMVRKKPSTIEVKKCNSTLESPGIAHRLIYSIVNSNVIKSLVSTGITLAQAYFIKTMTDNGISNGISRPILPLATIAVYFGLAGFVNNVTSGASLPMCIVLRCANGATVNLPLHMISNVSTVFSEKPVITKESADSFVLLPKTHWLTELASHLSDEEKTEIKLTINKLRGRILTSICSPEDYYVRRHEIFMDKVFGSDLDELKDIYVPDQKDDQNTHRLSLLNVLKVANGVDQEPPKTPSTESEPTETNLTIEYLFWTLLKAIQMKYNQEKSKQRHEKPTAQTTKTKQAHDDERKDDEELSDGPANIYIQRIDSLYHNNINAQMKKFLLRIETLKESNRIALQQTKHIILEALKQDRAKLTELHSKDPKNYTIPDLIGKYDAIIDFFEHEEADVKEKEQDMLALKKSFMAFMQQEGMEVGTATVNAEIDSMKQDIATNEVKKQQLQDQLKTALEAAATAQKEIEKQKSDAEARLAQEKANVEARLAQEKAKVEADAAAKLAAAEEAAAQQQRKMQTDLLLRSILSDIQRDNFLLEGMLSDLDKSVTEFMGKYFKDEDSGYNLAKTLNLYDANHIIVRLKNFMLVMDGRADMADRFQNLTGFAKLINGGDFLKQVSEAFSEPTIGNAMVAELVDPGTQGTREEIYKIEELIRELLKPLVFCQDMFKKLSSASIDSPEDIIPNLSKYIVRETGEQQVASQMAKYYVEHVERGKSTRGGRRRNPKNKRSKKYNHRNYSFTKKIRYYRKNKKTGKNKISARCRRK
jgi:hypothetical protein